MPVANVRRPGVGGPKPDRASRLNKPNRIGQESLTYLASTIRTSATFVPVGPVRMRPPAAFNNG